MPFFAFILLCTISSFYCAEDCSQPNKREERCSSIFEEQSSCTNSTFRPMLFDCLVTCNACDSFQCTNPQPETVLNCTALADQCESNKLRKFMKEKCPATCGLCNRKNSNLCNDRSSSHICSSLASFCNSVDYYDMLTHECPSTCNRCSSTPPAPTHSPVTCQDQANDCVKNAKRCADVNYAPLMHRLCAKTCKSCGVCEDSNKLCATWARNGYCRMSPEQARTTCAKTCGFCAKSHQ